MRMRKEERKMSSEAIIEKPAPTSDKARTEVEAYRQMDALDEQQIIDEQKGHVIDQYFYSFSAGGREIIGSSWAGTKFIASKMASMGHPIAVTDLVIEEGQDSYRARAKAKDLATGEERWGVAEQLKVDEKGQRNRFAYPIAASKAQRNALRSFIPEVVIQEGYREWKKKRVITEPAKKQEPELVSAGREEAKAEGTTAAPEVPVPAQPSPSWHVPVTKDQLAPEQISQGVKQHAITSGTVSQGMVNWLYLADDVCEVSAVPEKPVPSWRGPIQTFLIGKFLEGEKKAHSQDLRFEYELQEDDNGLLDAILIRGKFTQGKVNEIINAVDWAFRHVNEPPLPGRRDVGSPVK
jgi:hypothetical protein